MPYISQARRSDLDHAIVQLNAALTQGRNRSEEALDGDLNYVITRLFEVIPVVRDGRWRYRLCNLVVGVLECCKQEFYRRLVGPYEDKAIEKNGDVPVYLQGD
jgi:hypothetical protein